MTTIRQDVTRDVLLQQEIERVEARFEHYQGRIDRGTADDEDRAAARLYARILSALESLVNAG